MRQTAPSVTELRITAGLRRRDPDAVRALYDEHGPATLAFLRSRIRDHCAAEDILQQVLLEAWQRSSSYDPERASLRTWLATIARSRAIDHMRRRIPEPYDPMVPRSDRCEEREQTAAVVDRITIDELIGHLPATEAQVVRLQFHFGLSQSQIVALTGTPLGTVKSRSASALRHLRAMLDEEPDLSPAPASDEADVAMSRRARR